MRLVVTGAAGLTGAAVATELIARGHEVVGIIRRRASIPLVPPGTGVVVGDLTDPSFLGPVLRGADGLVHVAGILLGATMARAGFGPLRRLVVVSTAGVYSRHRRSVEAYLANEDALRAAHPGAAFVRPTMIYGSDRDRNVHHVIAFARRWRVLPLPSGGRALLQPIHFADLAAAVAILTEVDASGIVDAGGPAPITVRDAALAIFAALRARPILVRVPIAPLVPVAGAVDLARGSRWRERLLRFTEDRVVNDRRLIELTGLRQRTFAEGVRHEVAQMYGPSA